MCPRSQTDINTVTDNSGASRQNTRLPSDPPRTGDPEALDDPMFYSAHLMRMEGSASRSQAHLDAIKQQSLHPLRRNAHTPMATSFKADSATSNFAKAFYASEGLVTTNLPRPARLWLTLRNETGYSEYGDPAPHSNPYHAHSAAYTPTHERSLEPGNHGMDLSLPIPLESSQYISPYDLSNNSMDSIGDSKKIMPINGLDHTSASYLGFDENRFPYSPSLLDPFGPILSEPACLPTGHLGGSRSDLQLDRSSGYFDAHSNLQSPKISESVVSSKVEIDDARKKHRHPNLRLQNGKMAAMNRFLTSGQNLEIRTAPLERELSHDFEQVRPSKSGYDRQSGLFPSPYQFNGAQYPINMIASQQLTEQFRVATEFASPLHTPVYPANTEPHEMQRGHSLHQDGNLFHQGFSVAYQAHHHLDSPQSNVRQDHLNVPTGKRQMTVQKRSNPKAPASPRPKLERSVSADTKFQPKKHTRRRLLPRSKSGCWICRIKHLKCDELRPVCSLCQKFDLECDYSVEKPPYVLNPALRQEKLSRTSVLRRLKRSADVAKTKKLADGNNSRGQTTDMSQATSDGMDTYMPKQESLFAYSAVKTE